MYVETLQIDDLRYNPERAGFEAIIRIHDKSGRYDYPAFVPAPLNAEFSMISRALVQKAEAAHVAPLHALRLYHRAEAARLAA